MKKIISILLLILFISTNFSFADCMSECKATTDSSFKACMNKANWDTEKIMSCNTQLTDDSVACEDECGTSMLSQTAADCDNNKYGPRNSTTQKCCAKWQVIVSNVCTESDTTINTWWSASPATSVMGISCSEEQLVNGQCKLNIYDTLGIRKSVRNTDDATSVGLFVQDVVLSATFFIGTLVTIALIISWLMFIFAASSGKSPDKAKQWIMGSLIGLLIVVSSYVIIRLVQYIAKGF